jgi:hypothetical protein
LLIFEPMNQFKEPLFRCSSLDNLMSGATTPGETCISTIRELAYLNKYGIRKRFSNKFTDKGIQNEPMSLEIAARVLGWYEFDKNAVKERRNDDFLTGETDFESDLRIADVKSSFDHLSFPDHSKVIKNVPGYEWQMRGYMKIYQREQISLVYVLTPIPEQMIQDQIRREIWQAMANPAYAGMSMEEIESKVEEDFRNEVDFDVIPEEKRVREFILKRDAVKEHQLITRLTLCRAIYKEIFNQI